MKGSGQQIISRHISAIFSLRHSLRNKREEEEGKMGFVGTHMDGVLYDPDLIPSPFMAPDQKLPGAGRAFGGGGAV